MGDTSAHIQKATFGEEAIAAKVQSEYRRKKSTENNNKARNNPSNSSSEKCKTCGGSPCWYTRSTRKPKPEKYCLAKDMTCRNCDKHGHSKGGCTEKTDQNKSAAKSVKVRRIIVNKKIVKDDCEPTPTCSMTFKGQGQEFSKEVLPDTGCSQTIISEDLAKSNKLFVNRKKKKQIWNASNERMSWYM